MSLTRPPERKRVAVIGSGFGRVAARLISSPSNALAIATEKYKRAKAEVQGQALSQARRIKTLFEIIGEAAWKAGRRGPRIAQPTDFKVRMRTGHPMVYFDDGSLRHAFGHLRLTKKQRRRARLQLKAAGRTL